MKTNNTEWEDEFAKVWKESLISSRSDIALEGKSIKEFISNLLQQKQTEYIMSAVAIRKVYQERETAYKGGLIQSIQNLKLTEHQAKFDGQYWIETYEQKEAYNQAIRDIISLIKTKTVDSGDEELPCNGTTILCAGLDCLVCRKKPKYTSGKDIDVTTKVSEEDCLCCCHHHFALKKICKESIMQTCSHCK